MRHGLLTSVPLFASVVALALSGLAGCRGLCSSSFSDASNAGAPSGGSRGSGESGQNAAPTPQDASRAIAEADIVQLDQEQLRIYAMSKSGSLAIVDAASPGRLSLLGKTMLSGEPFEMYRRGDVLLTLSNRAVTGTGQVKDPMPADEGFTIPPADPTAGALLNAVDVSNPAAPKSVAGFKVPGEIADSRIVGNVLVLVTYDNASCYRCGADRQTVVTSFDVSDPLAPKQIDQIAFVGNATGYKRSVTATAERLYVGGSAEWQTYDAKEGMIDVIDISDTAGHLVKGAHLELPGPITSRWQMDESEGVLRVVSQRGVLRTTNGVGAPQIDTFQVTSSSAIAPLGHGSLTLPRQEALKSVRFDGTRGYAITFAETDPLFTIDLSDAANPVQRGELLMPGWVFHIEPRGDRLLALGLDRRDANGNLNVSLIDVSDMTLPTMLQRVSFGPTYGYSDAQITDGVMAEDQNRIQKAFRIFSDGLIAVPYSNGAFYGNAGSCEGVPGGIQLMSWTTSSLELHGKVPMAGNPRRAVRRDSESMRELIGISDSNVTSFRIDSLSSPTKTDDVVIGRCVPKSAAPSSPSPPMNDDMGEGHGGGYYGGDDYHGDSCF